MKRYTLGILAHVDAGKTTLSEAMLSKAGIIKQAGRVDHQNTTMDFDADEKARGITIYAKEGRLEWKDSEIFFIDTPGHFDFSAEMERSLSVLDAAILVISGSEGVQSHTLTIWNCLKSHNIPVILFVNKMDISHYQRQELVENMRRRLDDSIVDLEAEDAPEHLALVSDDILEAYMETGTIDIADLQEAFLRRQVYPVYFGSALKDEGVAELMDGLDAWMPEKQWPQDFGARIFKVSVDAQNQVLAHAKITGGSLQAKERLSESQKADQLRLYTGNTYQSIPKAQAGMVVAITGLEQPVPGMGLGFEPDAQAAMLVPCLHYELLLPDGVDALKMMPYLKSLMQQDPSLNAAINERTRRIEIQLMGEVQKEILQKRIAQLSGYNVGFDTGQVVFQETIARPVNGYGHFEPLRHYAEVHLRLEPLPAGSGLRFESQVSMDALALNWQRLIITHMQERRHRGVLTGAPITDLKIILTAGKAHNKHTEGGDFRQATYRAIRQGLMKAESILLEPWYAFSITTPQSSLSRVLFELDSRKATISLEEGMDGQMEIKGRAPVRTMMNIQNELAAASKGQAVIALQVDGYAPSPDQEALVAASGYDPESDLRNPSASVFCAHGAGYSVPYDEVEGLLHIPIESQESTGSYRAAAYTVKDEDAARAFARAGGQNQNPKKKQPVRKPKKKGEVEKQNIVIQPALPTTLIVDGYNMIYAWSGLKDIARTDLAGARDALVSQLVNFTSFKGWKLLVVFDGYRVKGSPGSNWQRGDATVVYTRYGQTADSYIEKKVRELQKETRMYVASSDGLIQNSILSHGASRISSSELEGQVKAVSQKALSVLKP